MRKTLLTLLILLSISLSYSMLVETASLRKFLYGTEPACAYDNWISHIAEGIAIQDYNLYAPYDRQTNGFGNFRTITTSQTTHWNNIIDLFLAEDWTACDTAITNAGFPYQLVQFNDTDTDRTYYLLREIPDLQYYDDNGTLEDTYDDEVGAFDYAWGLYLYNPSASRPIIVTVPHPCDDFDTPAMGAMGLQVWDAMFLLISGVGRELKWTNVGSYTNTKSLCDPTRVSAHPFNYAYKKFADVIRDQFGQREFSAQIHSYDWDRHEGHPNNQISAGNQKLCPNVPIRDLSNLRRDMIHQAPYVVIPANTIGIHDDVLITEYYSVNYSVHDFIWTDGEIEIPVNDMIDLPAYVNNYQMLYTLNGWNDNDSFEPFFHIEMDELPNCYEQTVNNYHWFFGWDEQTQKWDYDNLFTRFMQYYGPWVYHLEAVLDYVFEMDDHVDPTTPENLTVSNSSAYHVTLGWDRSSAYDFETYEILYSTSPIDEGDYQVFSRVQNARLASQVTDTVNVTGLSNANGYYFKIRALDKNGNYSDLSNEVYTNLAPANITSFSTFGMEQSIRVVWELSSQLSNQGFKIYRAQGEGDFELVDSWEANPGLSNPDAYTFEWWDVDMENGVSYTYKISSTNQDGVEYFHNFPSSAAAMPIQTIAISNASGSLTDSITFGNNAYATDDRDTYWDITKSNPSGSYVWNAFWQPYWGNNGTSLQQEIKGGYDVANEIKTWTMRTRSNQTGPLTISATGTFGRGEKLWIQDGGTYHNLLAGPYTFNNTDSNVRTFNLFWGNMQPTVNFASTPNQVVQGGATFTFSWSYKYPFLIDHTQLSLVCPTETIQINDHVPNTQISMPYLVPQAIDMQATRLVAKTVAVDGIETYFESPYTIALVPTMNLAMFDTAWQMVSNPWVSSPLSVETIFGAGAPAFKMDQTGAWSPTLDFTFGSGIWVKPNDYVFYSSVNELQGGEYNIDLRDGWNIIANPHLCSYDIDEIRFKVNNRIFRFGEMVMQDLVAPVLWGYANGRYEPLNQVLPYQAFLIRYYGSDEIFSQINFLPFWEAPEITPPPAQSAIDFYVAADGFGDQIRVGTHELSQGEAAFRLNLPKPPAPPFAAPRIYLPQENPPAIRPDGMLYSKYVPLLDENGREESVIYFDVELEVTDTTPLVFNWGPNGLPDGWQASFIMDGVNFFTGYGHTDYEWIPEEPGIYQAQIRLSNYEVGNSELVSQLISEPMAYPNPFNPSVNIAFSLAKAAEVRVEVYNLRGQKVKSLHRGELTPGNHQMIWNGKDDNGKGVASGLYLARIQSGKAQQTIKLMLMK